MFISKLIRTIESYDPYGMQRLNGVKATYITIVLFFINMVFNIPNPYFFFFYAPITALSAEIIGQTVQDKYKLYSYTLLYVALMVFLFDTFEIYRLLFLLVGTSSAFALYWVILNKNRALLSSAPTVLSLAAYSLLYSEAEKSNFYIAFNNGITTLVALAIIIGAFILFPLSYYYRLWLRALRLMTQECLDGFILLYENKAQKEEPIQQHLLYLVRFARLLPRQLAIYSILKINLLMNHLQLLSCMSKDTHALSMDSTQLEAMIQQIRLFQVAIDTEKPCKEMIVPDLKLTQLIRSWNYLCSRN